MSPFLRQYNLSKTAIDRLRQLLCYSFLLLLQQIQLMPLVIRLYMLQQ